MIAVVDRRARPGSRRRRAGRAGTRASRSTSSRVGADQHQRVRARVRRVVADAGGRSRRRARPPACPDSGSRSAFCSSRSSSGVWRARPRRTRGTRGSCRRPPRARARGPTSNVPSRMRPSMRHARALGRRRLPVARDRADRAGREDRVPVAVALRRAADAALERRLQRGHLTSSTCDGPLGARGESPAVRAVFPCKGPHRSETRPGTGRAGQDTRPGGGRSGCGCGPRASSRSASRTPRAAPRRSRAPVTLM